ncbi:dihydrodipicolinate synthase family protein [Cellulosimicrobium sp. CpK407]|uniref:dihydrodipicolinate synthase family protein n=1 Tax=unclassified Cellulosimicrobium TaxID=2624466 RepID=UPI003F2B6C18
MTTTPHLLPALVTAFGQDGALDLVSCRRLFARAATLDVEAHFVAGTTGEFVTLSDDERLAVIGAAVDEIGPQHVFAHVGAASEHAAVRLAMRAHELGARRFAAITPYYTAVPRAALVDYYTGLRRALDGCELFAYVFPDRTGLDISPEDLAAVVVAAGLDGVKVSVPGVDYVGRLVDALPAGAVVYSGNDALLPEVVEAGGAGVVSGVMQAGPEPFLRQAEALRRGDVAAALAVRPAVDALVGVYGPDLAATKARLVAEGLLASSAVRVPHVSRPATDPVPEPPAVVQA